MEHELFSTDGLQQLLTRLRDPYNVEAMFIPLDVKISGAIMTLQDDKDRIEVLVRYVVSGLSSTLGPLRHPLNCVCSATRGITMLLCLGTTTPQDFVPF